MPSSKAISSSATIYFSVANGRSGAVRRPVATGSKPSSAGSSHGWTSLDRKAPVVHRRRRRRVPVAVRRQPGGASGLLPAAERVRRSRRQPGQPRPLPPLDELLETGHVLGLNFPVAMNPGLARALGVMLKLDFQRAVLAAHPARSRRNPMRIWRDLLFVCDEYHAFATVGETDPTGDERAFALSRQARLIPIVATQSISSLRSALPGDESWRTLLQCFRTKFFLATSDEFTAQHRRRACAAARIG